MRRVLHHVSVQNNNPFALFIDAQYILSRSNTPFVYDYPYDLQVDTSHPANIPIQDKYVGLNSAILLDKPSYNWDIKAANQNLPGIKLLTHNSKAIYSGLKIQLIIWIDYLKTFKNRSRNEKTEGLRSF